MTIDTDFTQILPIEIMTLIFTYTGPCAPVANQSRICHAAHRYAMEDLGRSHAYSVEDDDMWAAASLPLFGKELHAQEAYDIMRAVHRKVVETWPHLLEAEKKNFEGLQLSEISSSPTLFKKYLRLLDKKLLVTILRIHGLSSRVDYSEDQLKKKLLRMYSIELFSQNIKVIPSFFKNAKTVSYLDFQHNQLTTLPAFFENFALLRLNVRDNPLQITPILCGMLKKLRDKGCEILCDPPIEERISLEEPLPPILLKNHYS